VIVLFVVPHSHRDPGQAALPPIQRCVDITAEVRAGQVRFMPTIPAAVLARYGPPAPPVTSPPDGLTFEQRKSHVLGELLTPSTPRYVEIADHAVPDEVHTWLAADPHTLLVLTWLTPDSYEALAAPDGQAWVHLVVNAVETRLLHADVELGEGQ
jgi:hypothetical protein